MSNIFTEETVQITDRKLDWKEAIKLCAEPLLENGNITNGYVDSMIKIAEDIGPFFDFGKNVAVPHSRPENGVNKKGVSILKVEKPVNLLNMDDHPISIFIVLAAEDNTGHLSILSSLSETLIDDEKVEALKNAKTKHEVLNIFNN